MKRIFLWLFLIICVLMLSACNKPQNDQALNNPNDITSDSETDDNNLTEERQEEENKYKLTVIDNYNYLKEPLAEYYTAGEEVKVQIIFLSGPQGGIVLNGEEIKEYEVSESASPIFTFVMPKGDSVLYTTQNGYTGYAPLDCERDLHKWDKGIITDSADGTEEMLFECTYCHKTKTQNIYKDPDLQYSFDELLDLSSYMEASNISSVMIDSHNGTLGGVIMHHVSVSKDIDYLNSVVDFINNTTFSVANGVYDGVGVYDITFFSDGRAFEFSISQRGEIYVNGVFYNSSIKFPTTGLFDDWYSYIDPDSDIELVSYGEVTSPVGFDISEIHLRNIAVDVYAWDYTKDADLIIEDETFRIISKDLIYCSKYGWQTVISEKNFGELIPEEETESMIHFKTNDGTVWGAIIVSNNVIYTTDELTEILTRFVGGSEHKIFNADGSQYVDRMFTQHETLTIEYTPSC